LINFEKCFITEITAGFGDISFAPREESKILVNPVNKQGNDQFSKSDFEAKKSNPIQFLRCGKGFKKRCRKYRAKLAILKSIKADFCFVFYFLISPL